MVSMRSMVGIVNMKRCEGGARVGENKTAREISWGNRRRRREWNQEWQGSGRMHACMHSWQKDERAGVYRYKIAQHHLCPGTSMQRGDKMRNGMPI